MGLLAADVYGHIRHALAGEPASEISAKSIANQAGRWFVGAHRWKFMERPQVHLSLRASISINDATWTEATRTLTKTAAFTDYTFLEGDEFRATAGADAVAGYYPIESKASANAIVLGTSIGAAANGDTDIDGTITLWSVALPSDFEEIIAISSDGGFMEPTDKRTLLALRTPEAVSGSFGYGYTLTRARSLANQPGMTARLELSYAPGAASADTISLFYRAKWIDLASDSQAVAIPDFADAPYLLAARAFALGYEEHDKATMQMQLAAVRDSYAFQAAIESDAAGITNFGTMLGGAASGGGWGGYGSGQFRDLTLLPPS